MAAGGTGGHVFPALAVAQELERHHHGEDGCHIEFLGTQRGLEARVIPAAGFKLRVVAAAGLKGKGGIERVRNLAVLPRSGIEAARVLADFKPQVVVGLGGYLAGPVMFEAAVINIPTLLIELNAVPGFTNRILAPAIRLAAVGFEQAAEFYGGKARVTGHPVRREFYQVPPKCHVPPFTVAILGGSQGAAPLNECVVRALPLLKKEAPNLRWIHQTGERDFEWVQRAYQEHEVAAEVKAFVDNVPDVFARADLVISRAGASTISEIVAAGKAAIVIPFPAATDQHQRENARVLEEAGGAVVIEQSKLAPDCLLGEIRRLLAQPDLLARMEQASKRLAHPDAASRIANLVEELAAVG
jgi:UDP-N-acetylglucosamine--N-acetylmuramyl-(pentapeptide) pyrophosphoryl-undecaprenol N-acetylglucosamine transferase